MRTLRALLPPLLLAASRAMATCPACAGAGAPKEASVWPIVGAFLVVPWLLAGAVLILVRRESSRAA